MVPENLSITLPLKKRKRDECFFTPETVFADPNLCNRTDSQEFAVMNLCSKPFMEDGNMKIIHFKTRSQRNKNNFLTNDHITEINKNNNNQLEMLLDGTLTDCFLKTNNGYIPGHRVVLCSNSILFSKSFTGEMMEGYHKVIDLSYCSSDVVMDLLETIYTSDVIHMNGCHIQEALALFHLLAYFQVPKDFELLVQILLSSISTVFKAKLGYKRLNRLDKVEENVRNNNNNIRYTNRKSADKLHLFKSSSQAIDGGVEILSIVDKYEYYLQENQRIEIANLLCTLLFGARLTLNLLSDKAIRLLCASSPATIKLLVNTCVTWREKYNWDLLFNYLSLWLHADPIHRIDITIQILMDTRSNRVSEKFVSKYRASPHLFYNNPELHLMLEQAYARTDQHSFKNTEGAFANNPIAQTYDMKDETIELNEKESILHNDSLSTAYNSFECFLRIWCELHELRHRITTREKKTNC
jgi:hypothetical protein